MGRSSGADAGCCSMSRGMGWVRVPVGRGDEGVREVGRMRRKTTSGGSVGRLLVWLVGEAWKKEGGGREGRGAGYRWDSYC